MDKLTQAKQFTNLLEVAVIDQRLVNQVTLLFLCLLCENVTVVSMMSFNLTSAGEAEALLCSGICLYFWHCFELFKCYY